jgi:hypothetical protein
MYQISIKGELIYIYIIYPIFIGPLGVPAQGPAAGRCDG